MSVRGAAAVLGGLWFGLPLSCAAIETAAAPPGDIVSGTWQHHQARFSYFGFTSLYTCDGLEGHVRQILLHIGARRDTKVYASGCPGPYDTPSHSAWVDADFYALAPAADADGPDTVKGRWTPLELRPRHPDFMGDGDCELIQGLKDLIIQSFSLRGIEYRADCVPNEFWMDTYAVKGRALRALPLKSNVAKG
jgi:hypothetical protein